MCIYIKASVAKAADWCLVPPCVPPCRLGSMETLCSWHAKAAFTSHLQEDFPGILIPGHPCSAVPENANEFGTHIGKNMEY